MVISCLGGYLKSFKVFDFEPTSNRKCGIKLKKFAAETSTTVPTKNTISQKLVNQFQPELNGR